MEIWHPCAGFETHYEVSNYGNVRSVERYVKNPRYDGFLKKAPSKILKQAKSKNGYLIVSFCVDGIKSNQSPHRLVARAFILNESNKPQVNHKDGNKHNNHIDNLEWCNASENAIHAITVLKQQRGGKGKPRAKWSEQARLNHLKALWGKGEYHF
jgi:hypothetical protein